MADYLTVAARCRGRIAQAGVEFGQLRGRAHVRPASVVVFAAGQTACDRVVIDGRHRKPGAGGEIQLTDGIASLLGEEQVLAYRYDGIRYDCGSKLGYLQATVDLGRRHPEVGPAFDTYLKNLEA